MKKTAIAGQGSATMDLFNNSPETDSDKPNENTTQLKPAFLKPLAAANRPREWNELLGQERLLGPGKPLRNRIDNKQMTSMIVWGPPGTGKSSFAKLLVSTFSTEYCFELLATETGVGEIKKIIQDLSQKRLSALLIVDEFHRFTKLQQDVFLRSVEEGQIVLVGLTTENPKYFLNRALMSRLEIIEFRKLSNEDLKLILIRAWCRGKDFCPYIQNPGTDRLLENAIQQSDGDARYAIHLLERVLRSHPSLTNLEIDQIETIVRELEIDKPQKSLDPELHYRWISDFIKAMRRGDEIESRSKLVKLIDQGEDPLFLARRLVIFAAEDVGLASPSLQPYIQSIYEGVKTVGLPEGIILLTAGTLACCRARKSREAASPI